MSKRTQEEYRTKTQKAKALYENLRKEDIISVMHTGLVADRIWVADKRKAYRLEELGQQHLSNIFSKYKYNGEPIPGPILDEIERRLDSM